MHHQRCRRALRRLETRRLGGGTTREPRGIGRCREVPLNRRRAPETMRIMEHRSHPPQYRPLHPAPRPLIFPSDEKRMENKWHRLVCKLLYDLLVAVFGDRILLGWDQFLYWDAGDPKKNVAPDVFGRTGETDRIFPSWKTWELGVPNFVFEIVSESSWPQDVAEKPSIYDHLGVNEVVVFDPEPEVRRTAAGFEPRILRAWRRIGGALVEVGVGEDRYYVEALGLWVRVEDVEGGRRTLRLARGDHGEDLIPEGEAKGKVEQARSALYEVILARSIQVDESVRARIDGETDLARLERWLKRAVTARSFSDVFVGD
jgi:hypothetical protein